MSEHDFFYSPPELIMGDIVQIQGDEFRHLVRVMRKKKGDVIKVVDGNGFVYTVILDFVGKNFASGKIQKRLRLVGEPIFKLSLAQAIPKGNRFEWVVEKATELGIFEIIPLICDYSIIEGNPNKMRRWNNLAIAAMKQCHRSRLPKIHRPLAFKKLIETIKKPKMTFIAHPLKGASPLSKIIHEKIDIYRHERSATIIVGPEGGFSDEEIELAKTANLQFFTLGIRRLRSETAGVAATAIFIELIEQIL